MKYLIINKLTGLCVGGIMLDSPDQYTETAELGLAPDHTGEVGLTWTGSSWTGQLEYTAETRAIRNRQLRDAALKKHVDRLNPLRWASMTAEQQQAWMDYRQALLDVPQQPGWPFNVIWPQPPTT